MTNATKTLDAHCSMCGTVTRGEVDAEAYRLWSVEGVKVQDAFPNLSPAGREMIKSGYCWTCQKSLFGQA